MRSTRPRETASTVAACERRIRCVLGGAATRGWCSSGPRTTSAAPAGSLESRMSVCAKNQRLSRDFCDRLCASVPGAHTHGPHLDDRQRQGAQGQRRPPRASRPLPARTPAPDRHAHRLRHQPVRRLHRPRRRPQREVLHDLRGSGRRLRDHDDRGPRAGRPAASACRKPSGRNTACSAATARRG